MDEGSGEYDDKSLNEGNYMKDKSHLLKKDT